MYLDKGIYTNTCILERIKKMTKKSIIISVISVICLVGIVSFAMYGCSSNGKEKEEKSGVTGQKIGRASCRERV